MVDISLLLQETIDKNDCSPMHAFLICLGGIKNEPVQYDESNATKPVYTGTTKHIRSTKF